MEETERQKDNRVSCESSFFRIFVRCQYVSLMPIREEQTVETIFDHRITKQELKTLFGYTDTCREEYLSLIPAEEMPRKCYEDLYALYYLRGDVAQANIYADMLKECDRHEE